MLILACKRHPQEYRKALQFAAVCLRRTAWRLRPDQLRGLDQIERVADGTAPPFLTDALRLDVTATEDRPFAMHFNGAALLVYKARKIAGHNAFREAARQAVVAAQAALDPTLAIDHVLAAESARLAVVVRDIFGNPFRPIAFSPSWRTSDAVALARTMYETREFSAMPILADALQDAGCDSDDVLNHCRGEGPHVRGCWVVDMVLGKE